MDKIIYHDGELHVFRSDVRRADYCKHFPLITTVAQFKASLRAGRTTDLGGYPLYFLCRDGEALSFASARENFRQIARAISSYDTRSPWFVVGVEINYEDEMLYCAQSGELIPCAYPSEDTIHE